MRREEDGNGGLGCETRLMGGAAKRQGHILGLISFGAGVRGGEKVRAVIEGGRSLAAEDN